MRNAGTNRGAQDGAAKRGGGDLGVEALQLSAGLDLRPELLQGLRFRQHFDIERQGFHRLGDQIEGLKGQAIHHPRIARADPLDPLGVFPVVEEPVCTHPIAVFPAPMMVYPVGRPASRVRSPTGMK